MLTTLSMASRTCLLMTLDRRKNWKVSSPVVPRAMSWSVTRSSRTFSVAVLPAPASVLKR